MLLYIIIVICYNYYSYMLLYYKHVHWKLHNTYKRYHHITMFLDNMVVTCKSYGICSTSVWWYYGQPLKWVCNNKIFCWPSDSEVCSASCCCGGFGLTQNLFHEWEKKRGANISKRGKKSIHHTISSVFYVNFTVWLATFAKMDEQKCNTAVLKCL